MSFVCTLIFKFLLGVLGNNALQLLQKGLLALIAAGHGIGGVTDFLRGSQFWNPEGGQVLDMEIAVLIYIGAVLLKVLITFNYKEGTQTVTFGEATEVASEGNGSDLDCFTALEKLSTMC